MKKFSLIFLFTIIAMAINAETFTNGVLKYEIISNRDATVKVIGVDEEYLLWGYAIIIPDQVEYDGVNFTVVEVERIAPPTVSRVNIFDREPITIEVVYIGNNVKRIGPDVFSGYKMEKLHTLILGSNCISVNKGWGTVFPSTIKNLYIYCSCLFPRVVKESHYNYSSGRDEIKTYDIFPSNTLEKVYVLPSLYETYRNNNGWDPYYRKIFPLSKEISDTIGQDIIEGTKRNKIAAGKE